MVGVGKRPGADVPGFLPVQTLEIEQQPHQFRNGDGRVGVIELHRDPVGKLVEGVVVLLVAAHYILEGCGHEKVLLP